MLVRVAVDGEREQVGPVTAVVEQGVALAGRAVADDGPALAGAASREELPAGLRRISAPPARRTRRTRTASCRPAAFSRRVAGAAYPLTRLARDLLTGLGPQADLSPRAWASDSTSTRVEPATGPGHAVAEGDRVVLEVLVVDRVVLVCAPSG